jgi:hypothetical protein
VSEIFLSTGPFSNVRAFFLTLEIEMSNKKSKQERLMASGLELRKPSLILNLENSVLALEQAGWDEETIFGFVNCIMKGFITNGEWSEHYLQHVADLQKQATQRSNIDTTGLTG